MRMNLRKVTGLLRGTLGALGLKKGKIKHHYDLLPTDNLELY